MLETIVMSHVQDTICKFERGLLLYYFFKTLKTSYLDCSPTILPFCSQGYLSCKWYLCGVTLKFVASYCGGLCYWWRTMVDNGRWTMVVGLNRGVGYLEKVDGEAVMKGWTLLTFVIYSGCTSPIKLVSDATKQMSQSCVSLYMRFALLINSPSLLTDQIAQLTFDHFCCDRILSQIWRTCRFGWTTYWLLFPLDTPLPSPILELPLSLPAAPCKHHQEFRVERVFHNYHPSLRVFCVSYIELSSTSSWGMFYMMWNRKKWLYNEKRHAKSFIVWIMCFTVLNVCKLINGSQRKWYIIKSSIMDSNFVRLCWVKYM